jgi:outer membrane protein assembly factor BamD (BamD/ComL family)
VATLEVELALMRRAHAALNDGNAEEALAALDEHARNFPSGVLAEDRAAQRVLALCALGRADLAREEGERFTADYSRSPHVAVVRGSCAFSAEPRR